MKVVVQFLTSQKVWLRVVLDNTVFCLPRQLLPHDCHEGGEYELCIGPFFGASLLDRVSDVIRDPDGGWCECGQPMSEHLLSYHAAVLAPDPVAEQAAERMLNWLHKHYSFGKHGTVSED